jgi:prepilin-type N-terminal cleavage/methylation domain-containing protein
LWHGVWIFSPVHIRALPFAYGVRIMKNQAGYTLTELLVTMSLLSVMSGFAFVNLLDLSNPARSAASEISGFLKQARARALSTTSAYTVSASSTDTLTTTVGTTCSAAQSAEPSLTLELDHADLSNVSWSICFTSRGFPDKNVVIPVTDDYSGSNSVEVLLGGAIRVL